MDAEGGSGVSIWLKPLEGDSVTSGQLFEWIESIPLDGIVLAPSHDIFKAPEESRGQRELRRLSQLGLRAEEVVHRRKVQRIRDLIELLLPTYERSNGVRGLLSVPLTPIREEHPGGLISAVDELWLTINRPNLMIALPCTAGGLQAFEQGLQRGYNLEIRSVLTVEEFHQVRQLHRNAISQLAARGREVRHISAVAAIDLHTIDRAIDRLLEQIAAEESPQAERAEWLQGRAATTIADLILAQQEIDLDSSSTLPDAARPLRLRWEGLESSDRSSLESTLQRFWSTNTICTLNPEQISGLEGADLSIQPYMSDMSVSRAQLDAIQSLGIDAGAILAAERERTAAAGLADYEAGVLEAQTWVEVHRTELGSVWDRVADTLERLNAEDLNRRIWEGERSGKLEEPGWLELPQEMERYLQGLKLEGMQILADGPFETILLVGSSNRTYLQQLIASFQSPSQGTEFKILNHLDPIECRKILGGLEPEKTLAVIMDWERDEFETYYLLSYLVDWFGLRDDIEPGEHLAAVTKPGSELADIAQSLGFRAMYPRETGSGVIYGPLNKAAVLPATLAGIDLAQVLSGEREVLRRCSPSTMLEDHPGLQLAAVLAALHTAGRNNLTLLFDSEAAPLSTWLAELLDLRLRGGPTPWTIIHGEPPGKGQVYDQTRSLIYLRTKGELDKKCSSWVEAGIPVLIYQLGWSEEELGRTILLWQYATAAALELLELNPTVRKAEVASRRTVQSLLKTWNRKSGFDDSSPLPGKPQVKIVGQMAAIDSFDSKSQTFWTQILKTVPANEGLRLNFFLHLPVGIQRKLARIQRILRDQYSLWAIIEQGRLHAYVEEPASPLGLEVIVSVRETRDLEGPSMDASMNTIQRAVARAIQRAATRAMHPVIHLELQDNQVLKPLVESLAGALEHGLDESAESMDDA